MKYFVIIALCSIMLLGCSDVKGNEISGDDFAIDESGYLYYKDKNLGVIKGQDGIDGENGLNGIDGVNGRKGIDGINGKDGVNGRDGTDGKNGVDGRDGKDGNTPYIGENGNWWISFSDTGYLAVNEQDIELNQGDNVNVFPTVPFEWAVTLSETVVHIDRFEIFVDVIDFENYSKSNTRNGYLETGFESNEVFSPYKANITISGTVENAVSNPYFVEIWIGNEDYSFNLKAYVVDGNNFLVEEMYPIYKVPNKVYFLKAEIFPFK